MMAHGVVVERHEGTPQGGPLSPLLANVLLDDVDKELERRGHAFVRYADDCNVYVRSRRAGERVHGGASRLYATLQLRVNEAKSAVARVGERQFLGFSFWVAAGKVIRRRVAAKALEDDEERVRRMTRRARRAQPRAGRGDPAELSRRAGRRTSGSPRRHGCFADVDEWIRHRLRALQLKQWKRGTTVFRELRARGMSLHGAARVAAATRRWWWNSAHGHQHRPAEYATSTNWVCPGSPRDLN